MKRSLTAFLLLPAALFAQTSVYVNPAGNNSNAGTLTAPWKTVQYALDHSSPGTTIYLMGGIYHENCVVPVSTTAAGANLTLRNYEEEQAVLEGSGNALPLLKINNVNHFTVRGIQFRNNFGNNADAILVSGKCNYISILNNTIHDISFSPNPNDPVFPQSMATPVLLKGDSASGVMNITISGNECYNNVIANGSVISICGNVSSFTIEKNDIHNNSGSAIVIKGHTGVCLNSSLDEARNGNIRWNRLTENSAGSMIGAALIVNTVSGISIQNNTISRNSIGINITSNVPNQNTSMIIVKNNCVFDNTDGGILLGTSGETYDGNVLNCEVNNNTIADNSSGMLHCGELVIHYCDSVKVHNNIVYGNNNSAPLVLIDDHHTSTDLANNIYYCAGAPLFNIGTVDYHNHNFFASALGNDQNSLFTDPMFSDISTDNFHLQGNSPAIDEGEMNYIASYNEVDMDTMARVQNGRVDAGADEYGTAVGVVAPVQSGGTNYAFVYNGDTHSVNVTFYAKSAGDSRTIVLYSADGRRIETRNVPGGPGGFIFDVSYLSAGTYVIFLQEENVAYKFVR